MSRERPAVSLVIPVYNEQEALPALFAALEAAAPGIPGPLEYVFVDDGSKDGSLELLRGFTSELALVKVLELTSNFGQHAAIMAGFAEAEGDVVVTLDADLQNPPADIPKLVAKVREGYDVAAGWRKFRQDPFTRRTASWLMNQVVGRTTGHYLHDYGCMMRAYSRRVVDAMLQCPERHIFVPVLANAFARRVTEVEVGHAERELGVTKYPWAKLWRLNFDLLTGLTTLPLHWVSLGGVIIAVLGLVFAVYLMIRRLVVGPEVEGVFTLFAVLFFFVGVQILAIGVIGEYLTRIYDQVRSRPRCLVRQVHVRSPGQVSGSPSSDQVPGSSEQPARPGGASRQH